MSAITTPAHRRGPKTLSEMRNPQTLHWMVALLRAETMALEKKLARLHRLTAEVETGLPFSGEVSE